MREVRHKYDAKTRDSKQTALPELPEILEPLDLSKMTEAELSDELEKGLEDMKAGRVMTAEKAFDGIRAKFQPSFTLISFTSRRFSFLTFPRRVQLHLSCSSFRKTQYFIIFPPTVFPTRTAENRAQVSEIGRQNAKLKCQKSHR